MRVPIGVKECTTAAEVLELARQVSARRKAQFKVVPPEPEPPPPPPSPPTEPPPAAFVVPEVVPPPRLLPISRPLQFSASIKYIVRRVATTYNVDPEEIMGRTRVKRISTIRQICMFLIHKHIQCAGQPISTIKIGEIFHRDHTTVIHGTRTIVNRMRLSSLLRETVDKLDREISEYVSAIQKET